MRNSGHGGSVNSDLIDNTLLQIFTLLLYSTICPKTVTACFSSQQLLLFEFIRKYYDEHSRGRGVGGSTSYAKRQYLLTCKVSRYCILALHDRARLWVWSRLAEMTGWGVMNGNIIELPFPQFLLKARRRLHWILNNNARLILTFWPIFRFPMSNHVVELIIKINVTTFKCL